MYTTYDRNKYCDCCFRPTYCACVCFYSLPFATAFILSAINIHTAKYICCVDNDLDGNHPPTRADGAGLSGPSTGGGANL